MLLGLESKFPKKLPLFGKIFIHWSSHRGIFDGQVRVF
jgi:hypothetical protein